jgi:hypothetical protein
LSPHLIFDSFKCRLDGLYLYISRYVGLKTRRGKKVMKMKRVEMEEHQDMPGVLLKEEWEVELEEVNGR